MVKKEEINFKKIEKKWQEKWEKKRIFEVREKGKKFFCLEMFPYPSSYGLHMGHALNYTIGDIYARFQRMKGFNVLYPMGYDSLGLPAENAAIKAGIHPKKFTENSIKNFIKQQKALGLSYDWTRIIETHKPEYYKWDQWIFLKMFEKGLAYRKKAAVNYCPKCQTVLANEQVHNGKCWRHEDTNAEIKQLEQWFLKITDYADELYDITKLKNWPEKIKLMQENWIGKSYGLDIDFKIEASGENRRGIQVENVEHFRKNVNLNSKLRIKNKDFAIKQIVKFRFDDGRYYLKLFLDGGYVLADDLGGNSFILVKEVKTNLQIKKDKIDFDNKKFDFNYTAHAVAEEIYGEEIFKKGESETFWDYSSKDGSYLSLGIIDKTKERLDFFGEIIYSDDIQIIKENEKWPIFTTRPDTIFGVTFMVVSAQHPKLFELVTEKQRKEVEKFLRKLKSVSEKEMEEMEKEGAFTGSYAVNPLTKEKIPVYAGNFVLADYGSGMVMGVPAHDERDFQFARKYKIPVKIVIQNKDKNLDEKNMENAYVDEGILVNSQQFSGLNSLEAIEKISDYTEKNKLGRKTVNYKLRDWLISRQRYWGTPIPIIYCEKCGIVPVPEKDLPVKLPEKVKFGKGNPLETAKSWINVKCPKCRGKGKRETDTMDTFVNSSWYFLRYCDNKNKKEIFDRKRVAYWMPVDIYIGGAEHACMHLIYFRFYTKFLRDLGLIHIDEPAPRLFNQGMLHGEDGFVMSKSRGNVVFPEEVSRKYGIDTARLFLVSMASPDKDVQWSEDGIEGSFKFVKKAIEFKNFRNSGKLVESKLNKAIKEITEDMENLKYNLAVIKLREVFNYFEQGVSKKDFCIFLKMFSVFCPHISEELWGKLGNKSFISLEKWPVADEKKIDLKLEEEEKKKEKLVEDIRNILKILEARGEKKNKIKIFAIPKELALYKEAEGKITGIFGMKVEVLNIKDAEKTGKIIKASPGKPGILIE